MEMGSELWRERGVGGGCVSMCVWRWPSALWAFERVLTLALSVDAEPPEAKSMEN